MNGRSTTEELTKPKLCSGLASIDGVIRAGVRTDSMIGETKFRIRKLKLKHDARLDEK